jgi:hypothetical protein
MTVTVGQRAWHLPRALLARHSTFFAQLCRDPAQCSTTLNAAVDAHAFANFADYMHSSIYTLNPHVTAFRSIRANTLAYLLGCRLGAQSYSDAALRKLHRLFEPLAKLGCSNARLSSIRAADVQVVWRATRPGDGLRCLFADAVASHWRQLDVVRVGADADGLETVSWREVYDMYGDFRERLVASLAWADGERGGLLGRVEGYLDRRGSGMGVLRRRQEGGRVLGGAQSGEGWDYEGIGRWKERVKKGRDGEGEASPHADVKDEWMVVDKDD